MLKSYLVGKSIVSDITVLLLKWTDHTAAALLTLLVSFFGAWCIRACIRIFVGFDCLSWLPSWKFVFTMCEETFISISARSFFSPVLAHFVFSTDYRAWCSLCLRLDCCCRILISRRWFRFCGWQKVTRLNRSFLYPIWRFFRRSERSWSYS